MIPASFVRTTEIVQSRFQYINYDHPSGLHYSYFVNLALPQSIITDQQCYCDTLIEDNIRQQHFE
jgi:hypothetical protein